LHCLLGRLSSKLVGFDPPSACAGDFVAPLDAVAAMHCHKAILNRGKLDHRLERDAKKWTPVFCENPALNY
jgi:hypothetical protein